MTTEKIHRAIRFAIRTHEVYQKQIRRGRGVPYIIHPLSLGIVLGMATNDEDVIVAGVLHDTIEDSIDDKKVTKEMLEERFGKRVSELVVSLSEPDKSKSWSERKEKALNHISDMCQDSMLIKGAHVTCNNYELLNDYEDQGEVIFNIFGASKENVIQNQINIINVLVEKWPENPFYKDLISIRENLIKIKKTT